MMELTTAQKNKLNKIIELNKNPVDLIVTILSMQEKFEESMGVIEKTIPLIEKAIDQAASLKMTKAERANLAKEVLSLLPKPKVVDENAMMKKLIDISERNSKARINEFSRMLSSEVDRIETLMPSVTPLQKKISELEKALPALVKEPVTDSPQQIADKINQLTNKISPKVLTGWGDIERIMKNNSVGLPKDFDVRIGVSKTQVQGISDQVSILQRRTGSYYKETPIGSIDGSNTVYRLTYNIASQEKRQISLITETPIGSVDGVNRTYYLSYIPTAYSIEIAVNGVVWTESVDYSINRATRVLTLEVAINPVDYPEDFEFRAKYSTLPQDKLVVNGVPWIEGEDYTASGNTLTLTTALNSADYPPDFPFTFQYVIDTSGLSIASIVDYEAVSVGHVEFSDDFSTDFY